MKYDILSQIEDLEENGDFLPVDDDLKSMLKFILNQNIIELGGLRINSVHSKSNFELEALKKEKKNLLLPLKKEMMNMILF